MICLSSTSLNVLHLLLWQHAAPPRCWITFSREYATQQTGRQKIQTLTLGVMKIKFDSRHQCQFHLCVEMGVGCLRRESSHFLMWTWSFVSGEQGDVEGGRRADPDVGSVRGAPLMEWHCAELKYGGCVDCVKFKGIISFIWCSRAAHRRKPIQLLHLDT